MAFYRFALFLYQNITLLYYAVKHKVHCVMQSTGSPSSGLKLKIEFDDVIKTKFLKLWDLSGYFEITIS